MSMGERIKKARELRGMLQPQLAKLIGVKSAGVISNWEQDKNKPNAEQLVGLCKALDIKLSYLLNYYGKEDAFSHDTLEVANAYAALPNDDAKNMIRGALQLPALPEVAQEIHGDKEKTG